MRDCACHWNVVVFGGAPSHAWSAVVPAHTRSGGLHVELRSSAGYERKTNMTSATSSATVVLVHDAGRSARSPPAVAR